MKKVFWAAFILSSIVIASMIVPINADTEKQTCITLFKCIQGIYEQIMILNKIQAMEFCKGGTNWQVFPPNITSAQREDDSKIQDNYWKCVNEVLTVGVNGNK